MKELSLNILDITQNSITAGAKKIMVCVDSHDEYITFSIEDNGKGMSPEMVKSVSDPFTTSRTTRKVGLGIPLLIDAAEQTGGNVEIESALGVGTKVVAKFVKDCIDCPPMGDMASTLSLIIQSMDEDVAFFYKRITEKGDFELSTEEMKQILGDVSLKEPEILLWITDFVRENEAEIL